MTRKVTARQAYAAATLHTMKREASTKTHSVLCQMVNYDTKWFSVTAESDEAAIEKVRGYKGVERVLGVSGYMISNTRWLTR
jgi:hypothetical protein